LGPGERAGPLELVLPGAGPMAGGLGGFVVGVWHRSALYGECVAVSRGRDSSAGDQLRVVRVVLDMTPHCRVMGAAAALVWPAGDKSSPRITLA
jgi:hypothetical protein